MEDIDIIRGAIKKASKNEPIFAGEESNVALLNKLINLTKNQSEIFKACITEIIFTHAFLKAFFGEGIQWFCMYCGRLRPIDVDTSRDKCKICEHDAESLTEWTYRAQKMVLEKDRLQYIRRFL